MATLVSSSIDDPSFAVHNVDGHHQEPAKTLKNSELSLHVVYLDFTGQILVVCTGPCGESFSFIEKSDVVKLLKKSISIHKYIDSLVDDKGDAKATTDTQRRKLDKNLRELGTFLFDCVFHGDILDIFNMTIGQASRLNINVLLRIMIANDFLNIIPWELLYDNKSYLCHMYDIIRHPFIHQPTKHANLHSDDIRVLFVGANPLHDIRVKGQIEAVQEAIKSRESGFQSLCSPEANYTNIANSIYDGIDILHFLAHGEYEQNGHNSNYYFLVDNEDIDKKQDRLPVEMLESFCRANPMRFAVLNACRSDQAINYNMRSINRLIKSGYYSMAHALIQTGVPCVVGMSHPISKIGAEIFARRLYRTVIDRKESVSKAIRLARLELFAHSNDLLPSDWLTLVLYSRDLQS